MTMKGCIIMSNHLFALDIGTRSVVGIILKEDNGVYHVEDLVTIEHKERSMIDGQIHNILSVANVITEIKTILEERHGTLKRVSVAAAGRALKTTEGAVTIDISEKSLFTTEDINRLELAAVQQAQQTLLSSSVTTDDYYYCVGYSVLHYNLDGDEIGSLIDQTGRTATASVIATFLPRVVVESLLSALKRADLEMEALTLEPIAAINVLIPPSMRRLNVALVDIGAGTSDIAITDNNTVIAYGMVPIAGDEVTEALSNQYLLDFPIAELAKRSLSTEESIVITDILGFEQTIPSDEVVSLIQPSIDKLASGISEEIRRLNNGKSPQAVMVVGGGSLTPGLPKEISLQLELPENRVGVRGLEALSNVTLAEDIVSSPALVTPIGIAIAARRAPIHYMTVSVNDKTIRLFELKEMTVADALLATNIKAKQLYGKPGLGMSIILNGKRLIIPGEHGKSSVILLNGKPASTKDYIANGDMISIEPSVDGNNATAIVSDLIGDIQPVHVSLDDKPIVLLPKITINGLHATSEASVSDRDDIVFSFSTNLQEVLTRQGIHTPQPFELIVNKKPIRLDQFAPKFMLGEKPVLPNYQLKDGDSIRIVQPEFPSVADIANSIGKSFKTIVTVRFNGEKVELHNKSFDITLNGIVADPQKIVKLGDILTFSETPYKQTVFSDLFKYVEYTLPQTGSATYQLLRNGETIGFNDPIFEGDSLEISFSLQKIDS